jgi:hypothetical protein
LDELNDLMEQQKRISSKVDDVVSCLQKVLKQSTPRSLSKGEKFVGWADSASAHGPDDDTGGMGAENVAAGAESETEEGL